MLSLVNPGRIHLSVDIESTSGPTLLAELGKLYQQENVLVYDPKMEKLVRLSDLPTSPFQSLLEKGKQLFKNTPLSTLMENLSRTSPRMGNVEWIDIDNIPPHVNAVHGHFRPDRFEDKFENPFVSIVLREPLDRAVDQYLEWKRRKGKVRWRMDIPYRKDLSFQEYTFRSELKNFQFKSMGDKRLGDFDLVGITECLEGFIIQLYGQEPSKNVVSGENQNAREIKYKKAGITDDLKEEFREYNRKDYDLYQLAKEFIGYCN